MPETIPMQSHAYEAVLAWLGAVWTGADPALLEHPVRAARHHAARVAQRRAESLEAEKSARGA